MVEEGAMASSFAPGIPDIPEEAPPEVLAFNQQIEDTLRQLPALWDVGAEAARQAREEGRSIFGPMHLSERAEVMTADTALGPIEVRVIRPSGEARGLFVHIHGGGWVLGGNHHHDPMLVNLADATNLVVASVDYRLAPEHPYPAGPDDCEAGTVWLVRHAAERFGVDVVAIGGESAGASLSVVTMLRLRDRHGLNPFRVALLPYGAYDLRHTPSVRAFGDRPLILSTPIVDWFRDQYTQGADVEDPDLSSIFADLTGMPPALMIVGDLDPLIDDSVFMAARWRLAGSRAEVDIWPGAIHAFDYFDTDYGRAARARMHGFVNAMLT
jgi:acetyl esterase/lipase